MRPTFLSLFLGIAVIYDSAESFSSSVGGLTVPVAPKGDQLPPAEDDVIILSSKTTEGVEASTTVHRVHKDGSIVQEPNQNQHGSSGEYTRTFRRILRTTFLPSTENLPSGYRSFCIYSVLQDLSTQLRSVLATQRVLEGVGVGRDGATALSATLQFLVRDGAGMAASLLFTAARGSHFGRDLKQWRLFADVIVDVGIGLEVAATLMPQSFFLPMICLGNMCKAMCGVSAGACGGAISLFWAERAKTDISDINAKFGAQNVITGSVGLLAAAVFARSISRAGAPVLWGLFTGLTALHIYCNAQCMRLITLNYFNIARFRLVAVSFINEWWSKVDKNNAEGLNISILSPSLTSKIEPLFFYGINRKQRNLAKIQYCAPFTSTLWDEDTSQCLWSSDGKYAIRYRQGIVRVSLHADASPMNRAKAYFHALLLAVAVKMSIKSNDTRKVCIEQEVHNVVDRAWDIFATQATMSGWDWNKTDIGPGQGYEYKTSA